MSFVKNNIESRPFLDTEKLEYFREEANFHWNQFIYHLETTSDHLKEYHEHLELAQREEKKLNEAI
jgi:hypothetical protein